MVNALGQVVQATFDLNWGVPLNVTDANNNSTAYEYDALGRITAVIKPGDSHSSPTMSYSYSDSDVGFAAPLKISSSLLMSGSIYRPVDRYYDGLGRLIQDRTSAQGGGSQSVTSYGYDARGLVSVQRYRPLRPG